MLTFIRSYPLQKAMRNLIAAFVSLVLTTVVIGNAFYQKKQFYPSIVYLTKSNPSMAVIYVQSFTLVVFAGKIMRVIFFGELRAAEFEHLMERSWYAVTETCLAFTVFRDDFSPKFVALFTLLLFLKSFHWLAEDRVDFMERSPIISLLFHVRVLSLLFLLALLDITFVSHAYQSTLDNGASVQLVFGFEYAILMTIIINIGLKYVLHSVDLHSETPWENKAVFLLYTELIMGFIKMILYLVFVFIMVRVYTLPLFAFRPMYYTMRAFKKALNDVILSRRAIRNMNTLYPDASPEELAAADNVCIICREDMRSASKKLPCNHIFHTACLRSWFQRQQTCPTCRLNILRNPVTTNNGRQNEPMQQQEPPPTPPPPQTPAPPNHQQQVPQDTVQFPWIHAFNGPPPNPQPGTSDSGTSSQHPMGINPEFIPEFSPLFPFMTLNTPPPLPPFSSLTDDQLGALERQTRDGVEMRIKCLQNISKMLDAAVIMMHQYSSAAKAAAESCPLTDSTHSSNDPYTQDDNLENPLFSSLAGNSKSNEADRPGSPSSDVAEEIRKRRLEKFHIDNKQS